MSAAMPTGPRPKTDPMTVGYVWAGALILIMAVGLWLESVQGPPAEPPADWHQEVHNR